MVRKLRARLDYNFLVTLTAFGIAMGYLEAVVVVYIRHILDVVPTPEHLDPEAIAQVPDWLISTEQTREAATIVMLVALALLTGRTRVQKLAVFLFAFGVWDIFYYIGLKALINWPASLATIDCLFLIPQPWYAPVWVPVVISVGMIAVALLLFRAARSAPHSA